MATNYFSGVLAGFCISIGCTAYLMCDNRYLATVFFCIGLLMVRRYRLCLYTGMVGKLIHTKKTYLLFALIGNISGTLIASSLLSCTRICTVLAEKAQAIWEIKNGDSLISLFFLGVLCNVMIDFAVMADDDTYWHIPSIIFGVAVFVLCGFEHCVADTFYMLISGNVSVDSIIRIAIVIAGNTFGGAVFYETVKDARQ